MTTPAWQPRAMQPTAGPQGQWPAPGTVAYQGQGPPRRPTYGPSSSKFSQSPEGSLPPFGNPNQLGAASGSGPQPSGHPMQKVVQDLSRCIAGLVTSSTTPFFQEECARIIGLPLADIEKMESFICDTMSEIVEDLDKLKAGTTAEDESSGTSVSDHEMEEGNYTDVDDICS